MENKVTANQIIIILLIFIAILVVIAYLDYKDSLEQDKLYNEMVQSYFEEMKK